MTEFIPAEKGVPIRQPSTANLMISSSNRTSGLLSNDFIINKNNSILNGYFTRIGATEVVFEWGTPNISDLKANRTFSIILDPAGPAPQNVSITIAGGFYTVETCLNAVAAALTTACAGLPTPPGNPTFSVALVAGTYVFRCAAPALNFTLGNNVLIQQLFPGLSGFTGNNIPIQGADLRITKYVDIVSSQLTYNQDLKDGTTTSFSRDVVVRWYMDFGDSSPPQLDAYNMPILMGYTPFYIRRIFSPPKQIKWSANQPIGQLSFQLYDDLGRLVQIDGLTDWLMTLQVSEV